MTLPSEPHGSETGPTAPTGGLLAGIRKGRTDKKLAAWVTQQFEDARRARSKFERQWYLNLQFYRGNQNVEFRRMATSTAGYKLSTPPAPPWRARPVINRIRPAARKEMSKLTAQKPTFVVVPATPTDEDHAAARVAEQVLEARYADLHIAEMQRRWVWWAVLTGTAFAKDYWDKAKGELVRGPDGRPMRPGDSCVEAVDPFHLFVPDLREPTIDGQPWVLHAATHDPQYVKAYYGIDAPSKTVQATELFTDDLLAGSAAPKPSEQVLCLEMWLQPGAHESYPDGGLITVVGDQVYQSIDIAKTGPIFEHQQLPFTKLEVIPSGAFYGESSLTDLVPLQRMYNRQRAQIIESANLMGKPKWLAVQGSVKGASIDSEPGQVIMWTPIGPAPTMVQPPPLPEYVQALPGQALSDMDDVSGQHEISRGSAPGQVTAATAISYLQEQDDTMLAWAFASLEDGMARLGAHLLSHVAQFWGQERTVRVVGDDGSFDAVQFAGSMLAGNTDVRVQAGSALPASKGARQATALELYKLSAFGPPGSPEASKQLLEVLDMSGMEKALSDWRIDERQAQRENTKMAAGEPVQPNAWDNHSAHIVMHNRFRKGQRFETLPEQIHQVFAAHVQAHEEMNAQQQMVAAMSGMGGAGPGMGADPAAGGDQGGAADGGGPPADDTLAAAGSPPGPEG